MNILAFALGALGHILTKWLGWYTSKKDNHFLDYPREYGPLIAKGVIANVFVYAAWEAGLVPWLVSLSGITLPTFPAVPEQATFVLYLFGGYVADGCGKTFMSGIERLLNATARRLGGENDK